MGSFEHTFTNYLFTKLQENSKECKFMDFNTV